MLLLDIGNTNVKVWQMGEVSRYPLEHYRFPEEPFYYINVNPLLEARLHAMAFAHDLRGDFRFDTPYRGMGIDRIAACYTIQSGVVVDAGSAITVDLMEEGRHVGGFIMPGLSAVKASFATISSKLEHTLNLEIDMTRLPLSTGEALSYATIKPIVLMIRDTAQGMPIVLTGGDGSSMQRFLPGSVYRENLVFEGMLQVIKEREDVC